MPTFRLTITTDNAAFDPDPAPELARILRRIVDDIDNGTTSPTRTYYSVRDINGNTVGQYAIKPADRS